MLNAPQQVFEEEGSVITACVSIAENTLLEREIIVTLSTIANPRNEQGSMELVSQFSECHYPFSIVNSSHSRLSTNF